MARLLLFLLFVTFVITGSLAVKSCSDRGRPPSTPSTGDGSALVALRDGSTMMAQQGSIGRQLVDWLSARGPGEQTFDLGGQAFVGRSAPPTPESIGRVSRLVPMPRAHTDVRVTTNGHTPPTSDQECDPTPRPT